MKKTILTIALIFSGLVGFSQNEETLNKWITTYNELNASKNWDGMISNFVPCINEVPDWEFAYYFKGVAHYQKQDYQNAAEALSMFVQKIDTVNAAYMMLAQSYNAIKQPQEALNVLAVYTQKAPNDESGYLEMSNSHQLMQDYAAYIEDLNKVISINANNVDAYKNLASAYAIQKDYNQAIANISKVIELTGGNNKEDYFNRAVYNYNLKTKEGVQAALEDYKKAEELGQNDANLYTRMYACYAMLQNNEGAAETCTKLLEFNPNDVKTLYNRGNAYYKDKKYKQAIADMDAVVNNANVDDKTKLAALKLRYMSKKNLNDVKGSNADLELINKMSGK